MAMFTLTKQICAFGTELASSRKQSERWYKSARWQRMRKAQLQQHPYCQCPHHDGKKLRADDSRYDGAVVDHKQAHREDPRLFWDTNNIQSMTKQCHDSFKQSAEKGGAGFLKGCDEQGFPLNSEHDWYR